MRKKLVDKVGVIRNYSLKSVYEDCFWKNIQKHITYHMIMMWFIRQE